MTVFSDLQPAKAPRATLLVPPSCFADSWPDKPAADVCCGIRTVAAADVFTARAEAAKKAKQAFDGIDDKAGLVEAYNDALVRWVVAQGTCDPNDVAQPWEMWGGAPEDNVFLALTPEGALFFSRAINKLHEDVAPNGVEADDETVFGIVEALADESHPPETIRWARMKLREVAELLGVTADG